MQRLLLLFSCFSTLFAFSLNAQVGCPGCAVNLPANLPSDTLYLQNLPDGQEGTYYNQDLSFRMPKTTTPVHAIDSTILSGLPISKIEIVAIEGVPPGLYWQPSQFVFETNDQTDGCVKFCGTPTQSDSFVMTVRIKATVLFIVQEATFPLRIYIAPEVSTTDGFSMTNFTGCGSTTVSFTNNIPSGGAPGFTYEWDFGDGTTFIGENPLPHTYNTPGVYAVNYFANIDTAGYKLESVTVLSVDCGDSFNNPDLYFYLYDPTGAVIFNSQPHVTNTTLPFTWPLQLKIGNGNYSIAVWDEDSGLKGTDDPCGSVPFNILSNDTLVAGGLTVVLNLIHEIEEIHSEDTVIVYPQPAKPFVSAPNGLSACAGSDSLLLVSSSSTGNQWLIDDEPIASAIEFLYEPTQTGYYQVQITNSNGCTAVSDSTLVQVFLLPVQPFYVNIHNSLRLVDTMSLPDSYSLQWYDGSDPIPGATGFRYCAIKNGNYGLLVTDLETGCTNFYASPVVHDPNFDCTIGTDEITALALGIFPNPTSDAVQVRWNKNLLDGGMLRVWDATGRLVKMSTLAPGAENFTLDMGDLSAGMFSLEILAEGFRGIGKVVVLR